MMVQRTKSDNNWKTTTMGKVDTSEWYEWCWPDDRECKYYISAKMYTYLPIQAKWSICDFYGLWPVRLFSAIPWFEPMLNYCYLTKVKLYQNTLVFIQEHAFQHVTWKMAAILYFVSELKCWITLFCLIRDMSRTASKNNLIKHRDVLPHGRFSRLISHGSAAHQPTIKENEIV